MIAGTVAFAFPGDIGRKTGGYIYDRMLIDALRRRGRTVDLLGLPASLPDATPAEMAEAAEILARVPDGQPIIVDGLALGGFDTALLPKISAPIVALVHHPLGLETGLSPARRSKLLRLEMANLAHAARVLVPSAHTARVLAADFDVPADRIDVAPPGTSPRPSGQKTDDGPPMILSVGQLAPRKGHETLLDALGRIADLDWSARIVGAAQDARYAALLADRRDRIGLRDRVEFAGELDGSALDKAFRAATIFALATHYEGYGMVFAEAMTYGLPIVSCAAGAVPDTVGTAGILVPVGDAEAFADALRRLLSDDVTRADLAAKSRQSALSLPTWDDTAKIVGGVLDALKPLP